MDPGSAYRKHREPLLQYLYRLTGDPAQAEDVAQETFLRLLENPWPKENLRGWLYTVARNLVAERARTAKKRGQLMHLAGQTVDRPRRPDEHFRRARKIAQVRAALGELRLRDQQVLLMREEGFSYPEIAEAIDVKETSVAKIVARALRRLASALEEAEGAMDSQSESRPAAGTGEAAGG